MKLLKCVSFFMDIGRGNWQNMGPNVAVSNFQYINNFLQFYSNVRVDLILFIEKSFEQEFLSELQKFKQNNTFLTNLNIQYFNRKDILYFQEPLYSALVKAHYSDEFNAYKNFSKTEWIQDRAKPEYNIVMLCKTYFLQLAKNMGLLDGHNVAGWIDFGIAHGKPGYIQRVKNTQLVAPETEKIIFFKRQHINLSENFNHYQDLLKNGGEDVITPGGFYIVPASLITFMHDEFLNLVKNKFLPANIMDDDQTFMSIFAAKNSNLVNLVDSVRFRDNPEEGDWFPVFDLLIKL